jgi:hypothetical protein
VTNILKCGLDRQPSPFPGAENPTIEHDNVRGPDYYHWARLLSRKLVPRVPVT